MNAYAYVLAYIWEIGTGYPAITTGDTLSSYFFFFFLKINTFATTRHICVTLFIIYICVQIDY